MGQTTTIEWCDSTVNPVMGCAGCELWGKGRRTCYAGHLHERRAGQAGFAAAFTAPKLFPGRTADAAAWPDLTGTARPDKPWLDGRPRMIFVSDMGDALSERGVVGADDRPVPGGAVPFDFLKEEVVDAAVSPTGRRHRWLWLTKRPNRLQEFFDWLRKEHGLGVPANLWLGTSATTSGNVIRADTLAAVGGPQAVHFLSAEPLWEELRHMPLVIDGLAWVIAGGESRQGGPARPFDCDWARRLRDRCAAAGVPFFLKQLGSNPHDGGRRLKLRDRHGGDWAEWPDDLRVRQVPGLPPDPSRVSLPVLPAPAERRPYTLLSEVVPQAVEWLWEGRVPLGEITVMDGDPAVNKTSVVLDLAARVSRGCPMPTGETTTRGGVVLLMAEDSLAKTLLRRLQAAGADVGRVAAITEPLALPADTRVIEEAVARVGARLVVIDPLVAYLGGDAKNDQSVRKALAPLRTAAERANAAVVVVRHLTKGGTRMSLYRGGGSIGIVAAARSALLVARDPEDEHMRVVAQVKNNLGPAAPSLRFEPVQDASGVVRVEWRGECEYGADDLLARPKAGACKRDRAEEFLVAALRDGPVEQREVERRAAELGIAYRTVQRAKEVLGVASRRRGFGPGSVVEWELSAGGGGVSAPGGTDA